MGKNYIYTPIYYGNEIKFINEKTCEIYGLLIRNPFRFEYNAMDVTDVVMVDCLSVNADSTQSLYQKALERNPDAKKDVKFREVIKNFF